MQPTDTTSMLTFVKRLTPLALTLFLVACGKDASTASQDLYGFVPDHSAVVIQVNDPVAFDSELKNNPLLAELRELEVLGDLHSKWNSIVQLEGTNEQLISITEVGQETYELTSISRRIKNRKDSTVVAQEMFNYENVKGEIYAENGITSFQIALDSVCISSTSKLLVENIIRSRNNGGLTNKELKKALQVADSKKSANIYINTELFSNWLAGLTGQSVFEAYNDWFSMDVAIDQEKILLSGISKASDSIQHRATLFERLQPQTLELTKAIPISASSVQRFGYDDYQTLLQNLKSHDNAAGHTRGNTSNALFESISEIALVTLGAETVVAVHSVNQENTLTELPRTSAIVSFRDREIYELDAPTLFTDAFYPIFQGIEVNYAAQVDDNFFFSSSLEALKAYLVNVLNENTLDQQDTFKDFLQHFGSTSTTTWLGINPNFKEILIEEGNASFQQKLKKISLKNYPFLAFQLAQDDGFAHVSLGIAKTAPASNRGTVTQQASVALGANLAMQPQWVVNHRNRQKEIVVQDLENQLYLISNKGKVLWKKQLNGTIFGPIQQVDLYKNGRLQLAFVTDNKLHVLDRNGKEVAPFPIKLDRTITQPLALFDYDNNRNYRFLVVAGKQLHMYDRQGKKVTGFTFTRANNNISKTPKHFRIANKDYLVIPEEGGKLNILDRRGRTRIAVNETIDFSENDLYKYLNRFTTTDKNGRLITIDTQGKVSKQSLNLDENHGMEATSKTLVTLTENILSIRDKKVELDFGIYSKPRIFYINNKIYVAVTDLQSNQVYVFDSQAKMLPNFPVYGKESIALDDVDNDKRVEFVVKGEDDTLLIYKVN